MKIFITGGNGLIGTVIVSLLKETEHELYLLDRNKGENLSDLISYKDTLLNFDPDIVLHMAWEGIPDYNYKQSLKNLRYGLDLYDIVKMTNCKKIITTGTLFEYGKKEGILDKSKVNPDSFIGISKYELYKYGANLFKDRIFIWARLFYVYGEKQRKTALIPWIIDNLKKGTLPKLKDSSQVLDYIHVDDVAQALMVLIEKGNKSESYNIGTGKGQPLYYILQYLSLSYNIGKILNGAKGTSIKIANIKKLKKLGWEPKIDIEAGLKRMVKYYE